MERLEEDGAGDDDEEEGRAEGDIVSYKDITAAMEETVESYCKQMDCDEHTMKLFNELQAKFKALRVVSKEKTQKPLTHFFRPQPQHMEEV